MKKQLLKERFQELAGIKSLNELKEGENFGLWFRAGVRGEKQVQQAKDLLTQKGIEFNTVGKFGISFKGKGYEKEEILQLLRDNGLTRFVIYDYENELEEEQSQTDKLLRQADILTDDERDYAFDVLSKMHKKLNPTLDVEKTQIIIDFAEAVLQEFYE